MKKLWGLFFLCVALMLVGCSKEEKPEQAFDTYVKAWNEQKFIPKASYIKPFGS